MRMRIVFVMLACTLALCVSPALYGQATGSFSGTVLDKSGAPISGASVTAISQGTGLSRSAKTDDAGHYLIPLLPVSIYTLRAEFSGFQTAESKDLRLQVDEARVLDFSLAPATQTAQVEVSASVVAVETTNPSLGQVITAQEVSQLPLNGRDFVQLATLTPGTVQETNTNSFFNGAPSSEVAARGTYSLSVGGSRANSTDWLLDGNDNNELTAGGIGIFSSIDDIQEFKVLTYNYSAEYGQRGGPTVLVTTKSGTNDFHGSLFEFFRNTSLDAKSFFATTPEKFNLNQFGGSVGGPIRRNKTFFFLDGEQKDQLHGVTFTGLVPTDAMKSGDFTNNALGQANAVGAIINPNICGSPAAPGKSPCGANPPNVNFQCDASGKPVPANPDGSQTPVAGGSACNKIPANLINPLATKLVAFYPEPNVSNPTSFNYVAEPVRSLYETKFDIRLDHSFSSSDNAFARFSYDNATSYVPGGGGVGNFTESNFFASNQGIINHGRNIVLSETHVFSPTTVNQVTGGYNRIFDYITSQGTSSCKSAKLNIPGANLDPGCLSSSQTCQKSGVSCGLTIHVVLGGYFSVGDRGFSPFQGGTNVFSIADSLDMIRGKHDIKVGMSVRANQMNVKTEGFQDGFFQYTGFWAGDPEADFLLGLSSLAIHDQTFKGPTTGRRWKVFRPFIQDDWRFTKDITFNLGLAWNLSTPISEVENRQANFNPATGLFLVPGVNGVGKWAGVQIDKTALEPRIGVAWKPRGSDKTAVRAGYAIYHDSSWNQGAQGLWQNPPYYDESDAFAFGGACTFAAANCATVHKLTPTAISIFPTPLSGGAGGFPIITAPPTQPNFTDFTGTIQSQNTDFKLGMVQQFNVSVEHELPGQIVLTVGYVGSRTSHILVDGNNINITSPSACGTAGYTLGCEPNGAKFISPFLTNFPFSTISATFDAGRAHYNGLQIKAETKSARHGVYALVGYTYSRTYDTGFADGLGTNYGATYFPLPNWQNLDWALSGINLNNNFTASVVYDLPFGTGKRFGSQWSRPVDAVLGNWQVTVIEKITSGFPLFVVDSNTFETGVGGNGFLNGNANSLIRPNLVPGCNPNAGPHTLLEWFNTACFAEPPVGQLGNASRAPVTGPDFVNTDFSVIKQFKLPWENMGLNFRAEFFNLFNHAQFATPDSITSLATPDIASPTGFGSIAATVNNPRLVQFGLKLTF